MAGRRRKVRLTFAVLHVESGHWEVYAGDASREILRSIVESEAAKLPRWVEEKEDICDTNLTDTV